MLINKSALFSAKYSLHYLSVKRDQQYAKYVYYMTAGEYELGDGWAMDWQRSHSSILEILKEYPELERFDEQSI